MLVMQVGEPEFNPHQPQGGWGDGGGVTCNPSAGWVWKPVFQQAWQNQKVPNSERYPVQKIRWKASETAQLVKELALKKFCLS